MLATVPAINKLPRDLRMKACRRDRRANPLEENARPPPRVLRSPPEPD